MHAASRPTNDTAAEPHRWTVEAADYDAALAEVHAAVPEGFVLLSVQVERPEHA
jgi:hypothetical protein